MSDIRRPRLLLVSILTDIARYYNKAYCYPSQATLQKKYYARSGEWMSSATINRHLRALERRGWFTRTRRHKKLRTGELSLHSTLYQMSREAFRWFARVVDKSVDKLCTKAELQARTAFSFMREQFTSQRRVRTNNARARGADGQFLRKARPG